MGDSWYISRGWKTIDNRSDLDQKAETAIKYARWVPEPGIDINVLVQMQKMWFFATIIRVHVNSKFCQPQQVKIQIDKNESRNPFSEIESNIPRIFKKSGIKIQLILV